MNKRARLISLATLGTAFVIFPSFVPVAQADATQTLYLSGKDKDHTVPWDFWVSSGRQSGVWAKIPVPSNWETKGFGNYTTGEAKKSSEDGQYRFSFVPPAKWRGQSVDLVFEGAMTDTSVKINGASAGPTHQGGFYRFKYDVTRLLQLGKPNLLEATVNKVSADNSVNRAEQQGDYWAFGGIYRPVYLEVKPAQHVERMAINARADGSFAADVFLNGVTDADTLSAQIQSLDGKAVGPAFSVRLPRGLANGARVPIAATIANPRLWTAETPNLYQVELKLGRGRREIHRVVQRFGFRTIEVRAGDGIYVNGRKIRLKGCNRHAFWPTTGRTTSAAIDRTDILLMKQMNMNAVRMSHYPPDQSFLDGCDELGLYVLDEIAGWQKKYDTPIGLKIVEEAVVRDVNHPSILFWDNGNEGGWNTDLDPEFALYDPQGRTVLHPWTLFNEVQAGHYKTYRGTLSLLDGTSGQNIFLPTEFLHGLYDGGAGAGLDDYWNLMLKQPRAAGGFIWAFLDEGLVRDDQNGALDLYGNHYPDGIVGPYRQKEGSFYTIKDIWSPIQLGSRDYYETMFPASFNGQVSLLNYYSFTDASQCRFNWQLVKFHSPGDLPSGHSVVAQGVAASPSIAPGAGGKLQLNLPSDWRKCDALRVTVSDPSGREINAWNWPIQRAAEYAKRIVPANSPDDAPVAASEDAQGITLTAGVTQITISKATGRIASVKRSGASVDFTNGPALTAAPTTASEIKKTAPERIPAPAQSQLTGLTRTQDGVAQVIQANYNGNLKFVRYKLAPSGWLELSYAYNLVGPHDYLGVSFDFPETQVKGVKWLGVGPYRVWKNRMRGGSLDVWSKAYNDTATGADTWNYPEFKGYYAQTMWAQLQTSQGTITLVTPDENLFLRLYTPRNGPDPRGSQGAFPDGDISFMDGIAPIGNKFHEAEANGPQSGPNEAKGDYAHTVYLFFGALSAAPLK